MADEGQITSAIDEALARLDAALSRLDAVGDASPRGRGTSRTTGTPNSR